MGDGKTIEHVVIRKPNYVAGTAHCPEVRVFVETNTSRRPLNESLLATGQTVWMKWKNGPIVANSRIAQWTIGNFTPSSVRDVRELCKGTNLYELEAYWESVRRKGLGHFAVVRLRNEEWLNEPITSAAKSYGSPWVYLDTNEKLRAWLTPSAVQVRTNGRAPLPPRLRFEVLRRDSFTCRYCGRKAPFVELHVDHVVPYRELREHRLENLVTACVDCNLGKGARLLGGV